MTQMQRSFPDVPSLAMSGTGLSPVRGWRISNIVPYQTFATADGDIILAVGNDGQFQRFCEFAGCAALADDSRFATSRRARSWHPGPGSSLEPAGGHGQIAPLDR